MAYTQEEKDKVFNSIIEQIEEGRSLRSILKQADMPSSSTFFIWISEQDDRGELIPDALIKSKRYAMATDLRTDALFDEMMEIAYTAEEGQTVKETDKGTEITKGDMLGHRRLKIDVIKWSLSKLNPKKFGDKVDVTSGGDKINSTPIFPENPLND